ncbi:MAG: hypothetical protein IRZ16_16230 [Myxococcaceae bacterium]|nr:hypothetical protein [Myxococcaceae bacterium]
MPRTESWTRADRQTVVKNGVVDHNASAKANLKEAGKNVADIFRPNHFTDMWNSDGSDYNFGPAMTVLAAPWLALAEVADVVTGPVKAVKNTADAVVHKVVDWF